MWKEFRDFIARGSVIDLAVGIIIGAAFTGVVNSLVNDVIMPPIGYVVGGIDFSNIAITLSEATADTEAVTIGIGAFINAIVNFLIVAFVVFLLVRGVNRLMTMRQEEVASEEEKPAVPTDTELMLEELRGIREAVEKGSGT